jgi:hypothetical protein
MIEREKVTEDNWDPVIHGYCCDTELFVVTKEEIKKWWELDYSGKDCYNEAKKHPYQSERCPNWMIGRVAGVDGNTNEYFCNARVQSEWDLPHLTSTELLLVAHDEWKCRQERKHYDDEVPWTAGWISGFLTSRKWANEKVAKLRQAGEP